MNIVNKIRIVTWIALILALCPVFADEKPAVTKPLSEADVSNYPIGPGDVLDITVWKEPELLRQIVVPPDGVITFTHAGRIKVEGKSLDQIQKVLEERLGKIIVDPIVTVFLLSYASNKIYVIGKVNRPGEFPVTGQVDVMQALAMAGGMASFADKDSINILRRKNGVLTSIPFDYSEVADGENLEQNIILEKDDVVVVQ